MKKYIVHICRTRTAMIDIEVEAQTEQQAEEIVRANAEKGQYEVDFSECEGSNGSEYEIDWTEEAQTEYAGWESLVIASLASRLQCTYQDAQDIVEAQDFYMTQAWTKGLSPEDTATLIDKESKINKG